MERASKRKLSLSATSHATAHETNQTTYRSVLLLLGASGSTEAYTSTNASSPAPPPFDSKERPDSDHDLVSAAEALTQLTQINLKANCITNCTAIPPRTTTPPTNIVSRPNIASPLPSLPLQSTTQHPLVASVNKVSRHPIVTNAVKYYDYSKRTYAPFNYAAEIVEKAAFPVVTKIELNLNNRYQAKQARKGSKKRRLEEQTAYATVPTQSSSRRSSFNTDTIMVSLETKKRLQFCLHILRLANDKINNLVHNLQQKVVTKEIEAREKRDATDAAKQDEAQKTKTEIVTTVKNIIRLISNFKPSSLSTSNESSRSSSPAPRDSVTCDNLENARCMLRTDSMESTEDDQLKGTIRRIILSLPTTVQQSSVSSGGQQTNDRVLVFAKESLDMISRLTTVFNHQLEKAEAWVAGEQEHQSHQDGPEHEHFTCDNTKALNVDLRVDTGFASESSVSDGESTLTGSVKESLSEEKNAGDKVAIDEKLEL